MSEQDKRKVARKDRRLERCEAKKAARRAAKKKEIEKKRVSVFLCGFLELQSYEPSSTESNVVLSSSEIIFSISLCL
jgi:hypothetical protein